MKRESSELLLLVCIMSQWCSSVIITIIVLVSNSVSSPWWLNLDSLFVVSLGPIAKSENHCPSRFRHPKRPFQLSYSIETSPYCQKALSEFLSRVHFFLVLHLVRFLIFSDPSLFELLRLRCCDLRVPLTRKDRI